MHNDHDLIEAIRAGEHASFALLVEKYQSMAFNVALRILRNPEEAEEAAQDAFLKVYRHASRFDEKSKFSTWFYRIVMNEALGRARKKKIDQMDISEAIAMVAPEDQSDEHQKVVRMAILSLNEKDAMLLTLFYLKELSMDEIGEMLDIPSNTVKVSVHRARKRLAEKMLEQIGDEVYELVKN